MDALTALLQTLPTLTEALGPIARTTLYDLRTTAPSVVATHGRGMDSTASEQPVTPLPEAGAPRLITTMQGRVVRSSWTTVTDGSAVIAVLHIEVDVTMWSEIGTHADWSRNSNSAPIRSTADRQGADMEELRAELVQSALDGIGVPVGLMLKNHKLAIVRALDANGFFLLRESVPYLAATLSVSRHSIYNYLNDVRVTDSSRA